MSRPPAPPGEAFTEVIQVKVTPAVVERYRAAVKAMNLRSAGATATLSSVGRDALMAHLVALEAEYGRELAAVAEYQTG